MRTTHSPNGLVLGRLSQAYVLRTFCERPTVRVASYDVADLAALSLSVWAVRS